MKLNEIKARNLTLENDFEGFAKSTEDIDYSIEDLCSYVIANSTNYYWLNIESVWGPIGWIWDTMNERGHFSSSNITTSIIPRIPDSYRIKDFINTFKSIGKDSNKNFELLDSGWNNLVTPYITDSYNTYPLNFIYNIKSAPAFKKEEYKTNYKFNKDGYNKTDYLYLIRDCSLDDADVWKCIPALRLDDNNIPINFPNNINVIRYDMPSSPLAWKILWQSNNIFSFEYIFKNPIAALQNKCSNVIITFTNNIYSFIIHPIFKNITDDTIPTITLTDDNYKVSTDFLSVQDYINWFNSDERKPYDITFITINDENIRYFSYNNTINGVNNSNYYSYIIKLGEIKYSGYYTEDPNRNYYIGRAVNIFQGDIENINFPTTGNMEYCFYNCVLHNVYAINKTIKVLETDIQLYSNTRIQLDYNEQYITKIIEPSAISSIPCYVFSGYNWEFVDYVKLEFTNYSFYSSIVYTYENGKDYATYMVYHINDVIYEVLNLPNMIIDIGDNALRIISGNIKIANTEYNNNTKNISFFYNDNDFSKYLYGNKIKIIYDETRSPGKNITISLKYINGTRFIKGKRLANVEVNLTEEQIEQYGTLSINNPFDDDIIFGSNSIITNVIIKDINIDIDERLFIYSSEIEFVYVSFTGKLYQVFTGYNADKYNQGLANLLNNMVNVLHTPTKGTPATITVHSDCYALLEQTTIEKIISLGYTLIESKS